MSAVDIATNALTEIMEEIVGTNSDLEMYCKEVMDSLNLPIPFPKRKEHVHVEHLSIKSVFVGTKEISPIHMKNHAIRFNLSTNITKDQVDSDVSSSIQSPLEKKKSVRRLSLFSSTNTSINENNIYDYEDVLDMKILLAPICDICIIGKGDVVPDGFYRLSKSVNYKKADLNSKSGGSQLYLCIRKDLTGLETPVSNLVIIYPEKEQIPPGYSIIRLHGLPCNVNSGSSYEKIYISNNFFVSYKFVFRNKYGNGSFW